MKKIVLISFCLICINQITYSQKGEFAFKKNHISIDPILPVFGTVQIAYERRVFDRISINLVTAYKASSGLFPIKSLNSERFDSENINLKGLKIIPEVRWYFQKSQQGLFGMYLGAYFRYQFSDSELKGTYNSKEDIISPILIDVNLTSATLGVQLGYKVSMGGSFYADFLIAGPGMSFNTLELVEIIPIPDDFYDDITDSIKNGDASNFIKDKFKINGNQNTRISLPALRYGVKFGYSF